ncbi:MAG: hypothetical protein O7D34_05295 [Ignavibacteria bacterium]|nr:hypothetical protein [Ignavibacteria bacterium]
MTPFEWGMLILSAIGAASAATSGVDVDTEQPAPPGGAAPTNIQPIFGSGGLGGIPNLPPAVPDITGPAQAAATAAAGIPETQVTTPPEVPAPGGDGEEGIGGVGQVLAALPQALAAVAPLLGLGPQPIPTQTAAPIAGGQPGSPVGQFAQPFGQQLDIGRLLAALPGIGR